jgi:hypothetical protein
MEEPWRARLAASLLRLLIPRLVMPANVSAQAQSRFQAYARRTRLGVSTFRLVSACLAGRYGPLGETEHVRTLGVVGPKNTRRLRKCTAAEGADVRRSLASKNARRWSASCSGAEMRNLSGALSMCACHPAASMPKPRMWL